MPDLPPAPQREAGYFDYLEGLKRYNYRNFVRRVLDDYDGRVEDGQPPRTMEEAGDQIIRDPLYRVACAIQRTSQEMAWSSAATSLLPHREQMARMLNEDMPPGHHARLELDPGLELPGWYVEAAENGSDDIHLQPYWGDELVGPIYQRGGGIYRTAWRGGYGKDPVSLRTLAESAAPDRCERILDLGCSFGSNTIAFRLAFPEAAEVIGIDVSADALKWAFHSAEHREVAITFAQRDATATGYPDEHFDLITAYLLLHEMPPEAVDAMLAEAYRLLRPGGELIFLDIPRYGVLDPEFAFLQSFDQVGNGERFWDAFLSRDLPADLEAAGFSEVREHPLDLDEPSYWGSAALMRDGRFHAANRWTTHARKSA
jgi:SAM-dependent methyltransferase